MMWRRLWNLSSQIKENLLKS
jgi:hypothetical protein